MWDIREHHLLQMVSVKFPFTQRLPDFGPSPLTLLPHPSPTLTITCNEYIARYTLSAGQSSDAEGAGLSHAHPVCAVLYSPVLHQVLSGSEGGEVRVWEAASGKCVLRIERCHGQHELTALAVDSEGRRVLTGARDGAIKVSEEEDSVAVFESCPSQSGVGDSDWTVPADADHPWKDRGDEHSAPGRQEEVSGHRLEQEDHHIQGPGQRLGEGPWRSVQCCSSHNRY